MTLASETGPRVLERGDHQVSRKKFDPNVVKVVADARGRALYFSRSPIPYYRDPRTPGTDLRAALAFALKKAHEDDSVRVVVLTGEGRTFSAGADLKAGIDRDVEEILQVEYRPIQEAITNMPKPVIAAVPGSAAGIGLSLALTCDLLIMADNAFLLSPFTTISLVPDGGSSWFLARRLGYHRAFQLCVEAEAMVVSETGEMSSPKVAPPRMEPMSSTGLASSAPPAG